MGPAFKYLPIDGLDFLEIWEEILKVVPEAVVLAVGFDGDRRWKDASARVGNRIRTLGAMPHSQLLKVQDVADLYVEAFPFGTTTSLLEAGLKGIPVGLAPGQSPPPYGTDGIALDDILQRPATVAEYQATMRDLCRSADGRAALGSKVRDSILRHHSGAGWREHLETAIKSLPREHTVLSEITPVRTPAAIHETWSLLVPQWTMGYENTLEIAATRALSVGLRPRLTAAVSQACRDHQALRSGRTVPVRALALLLNVVLPLLPGHLVERSLSRFRLFMSRLVAFQNVEENRFLGRSPRWPTVPISGILADAGRSGPIERLVEACVGPPSARTSSPVGCPTMSARSRERAGGRRA